MNPDFIMRWLKTSRKGDQVIYHIGHLIADRERSLNASTITRTAELLRAAQESGRVALTQRKVKDDQYEYMAERTGVA
jgi:hypothetical protein